MMAGRSYSVSFNIQGALDGSLLAALKNAANAMRGLGNAARVASASAQASQAGLRGLGNSLNSIQAAAQKFSALQDALRQTTTNFSASTAAIESAKAKYQADAAAVEQLRQKVAQLNTELGRSKSAKISEQAGLKNLRQQMQELKRAYDLAKTLGNAQQMSALTSQMTALNAQIRSQQERVRATAAAFKELSDKVKQTKADLKAATDAANASGQGLNRARSDAQRLSQTFQQQLAALNRLKASLTAAGFDTSNFAASEARLASEINRVNAALERQTALTNAQRSASEASQNMFNAYNNFQGALNTAEQIAAPFADAAKNAITFEYAMSKVKALTQMRNIRSGNLEQVRVEMEALTKQAEQLGATTEFTATEVAEAMGYYGMAGWNTERIQAAMQSTLDLATIAGDHNIPRTADVFSDAMTALGLQAGRSMELTSGKIVEESVYFTDAFAYAITQANLNREQLFEALKYNAPTSHAAGLSIGETLAMNMVAANAGIKGSMAGTAFRAGWTRFLAPPKTAAKALAEMGMTASDATREVLEAGAALESIGVSADSDLFTKITKAYEHYQTLDKNSKANFLKSLVGQNALSTWQTVFDKGNIEQVAKIAAEIDSGEIEGWAADTAKVMRDNTKTSIDLLTSSLDALQKSVGDALLPAIRSAAEAFAPLITSLGEWVAENPAVVQAAATIAAALGGIIVTAAAVSLAFAGWNFIVTQIGLVSAALSSLGSGALLGGLIGRLAALRTALFGLGGAATLGGWGAMFGAIAARATAAATAIRTFFASLTLGGMASGVVGVLQSIGTAIAGAARAAFAFAFSPVGVALMALALAGMYCYQNWEKVAPVLSNIANIITSALSSAIQTLQPAIQNLMSAFDNLAGNGALSQLGMLAAGALAAVATAIAGILATIINVGATILSTITNVISGVVNLINSVLVGDIKGAFESMKSIATAAFDGIGQVASNILDGILTTVKAIGEAWDFISGTKSAPEVPAVPAQSAAHVAAPAQTVQVQVEVPDVKIDAPKIETPEIKIPEINVPEVKVDATDLQLPTMATPEMIAPETSALDTTATQAALDAVGDSATNAATQMDGVNQAAQSVSQVGESLGQLPSAVQPAAESMAQLPAAVQPAADGLNQMVAALPQVATEAQNVSTAMQAGATSTQAHTSALDANAAALNANIGALNAFGAACNGAVGGVQSLGSAASSAASSVSGLGTAAQSACAALAAAGANAASAVNAAVASMPSVGGAVAANAEGGIYRKGAFLTTFAEKSPEAAIPLNNSQRARNLWTQAGAMLGILPQTESTPFDPTITTPPTIPDQYPRGDEIPARRTRRRQMQGERPPVRMPQRQQPSIMEALGKIFGGGLIGQRPIFNAKIDPLTTTTTIPRIDIPPIAAPQIEMSTFAAMETLNGLAGDMPSRLITTQEGGLRGGFNIQPVSTMSEENFSPTIQLTVNVTVNGHADEAAVRRGVESTVPAIGDAVMDGWARARERERRRRSYT